MLGAWALELGAWALELGTCSPELTHEARSLAPPPAVTPTTPSGTPGALNRLGLPESLEHQIVSYTFPACIQIILFTMLS